MSVSYELLSKQNADTSNALIDHLSSSAAFSKLSDYEGTLTVNRDKEDDDKLQVGIDFAKNKGVLDPNFVPEPYLQIDVLGKTPSDVADIIISSIKSNQAASDGSTGSVIVLCGLSGTGKGTTVETLKKNLQENEGKDVVTWSNGNVFRSVTLLAATWCEHNSTSSDNLEQVLTKENLESWMSMLSFGKFNGKYDIRINGLGLDMLVSDVQNTILKGPNVSKNIPTVAQVTQGEVVLFAANAVDIMGKDGLVVLLEGREQTVNYVRTPLRYTLILSDESLIGKRRAAQRLMAAALAGLEQDANNDAVASALGTSIEKMVAEIDA